MTPALTRTFLPAPPLPPGRPRLVLAGFMGTGKTEAGRRAAALLGLPFVDADEVAVRRAGRSVDEIFERKGEAAFRRLEEQVLADLAQLSGVVIATGGGAVLHTEAFAAVCDGAEVAVLTAAPEVLAERIGRSGGRPLVGTDDPGAIARLLQQRGALYAAAGGLLDTTTRPPDEVAAALVARYRRRTGEPAAGTPARIEVASGGGSYPVLVGAGAIELLAAELARVRPGIGRAVVVVDEQVESTVGPRVTEVLRAGGIETRARYPLPAGEAAKSLSCVADLWTWFRAEGLDRTGVVVAVGGGATLDVAGFAAATYARGVPLVNVATTLLACVDASLGGKVAIDHDDVKNLVGSFHDPTLVVADTSVLTSLPGRVFRAGLAECVKAAVLASRGMLELVAGPPCGDELPVRVDWIVEQSVRIKAAYVAADPEDRLLRQSLNLGHTFAHAIEAASDYAVPHGEAVAVGLVAAARLGVEVGSTTPDLPGSVQGTLERLGLPVRPPAGLSPERVRTAVAGDKKRRAGRPVLIVPAAGGAELVEGLTAEDVLGKLRTG
jgi:shikimate kinase/3-dehydroquinate synthase